jgi:aminoglycoside 3-N-acetyltransferase
MAAKRPAAPLVRDEEAHTIPGMPTDKAIAHGRPVTRSELERDLRFLGVQPGGILMVHTRMSAIGWVVGGSQTVVEALLEVLGPNGTLMAYAGWEDDPWHLAEWPAAWQQAYRVELPPFDPELSEADHQMGRLPERIRTWPGAKASTGHVMRMVALGSQADWLTRDQPWDHPAGPGSPLAKLVEADGRVLMLGAPLDTLTLLHHAESLVDGPGKRMVTYTIPVRESGRVEWREVYDHDTSSQGAFPYGQVIPNGEDAFAVIGRLALAAGAGISGKVGDAESHLFQARLLVDFTLGWLQRNFGGPASGLNGEQIR